MGYDEYSAAPADEQARPAGVRLAGTVFQHLLEGIHQTMQICKRVVALNGNAHPGAATPLDDRHLDEIVLQESRLQGIGLARAQRYRDHLTVELGRIGLEGLESANTQGFPPRPRGQLVTIPRNPRPVVLPLEGDCVWHGQVGSDIVGALPLMMIDETRGSWMIGLPAPADDEGFEQLLHVAASVEKCRALWGAKPLVAVASVEITTQAGKLEWQLARNVRPIQDCDDAVRTRTSH